MKKIRKSFVWLFFFLIKISYSSFLWIFFPKKILYFEHGWDTLHPFSVFSFGGVTKKDFLALYKKMKNGEKISSNEYHLVEEGSLKYTRQKSTYKHFSFRKAYG